MKAATPIEIMNGQLFVCASGEMLPRWAEAFPEAGCLKPSALKRTSDTLLWVRLPQGEDAALYLGRARQKAGKDARLVAMSDLPNDEEGLACLAAGAAGYLNTHATAEALRLAADVIRQGGLWIGSSLMQRMLRASTALTPAHPARTVSLQSLTARELEVARAVSCGDSNKAIAQQLGITERTVKAHISVLFEKLGVRDRLQLALAVNASRL